MSLMSKILNNYNKPLNRLIILSVCVFIRVGIKAGLSHSFDNSCNRHNVYGLFKASLFCLQCCPIRWKCPWKHIVFLNSYSTTSSLKVRYNPNTHPNLFTGTANVTILTSAKTFSTTLVYASKRSLIKN